MKYYYELLNLKEGANKDDIVKAFRKLAKRYHPDISNNHEHFIQILNAYHVLISQFINHKKPVLKKNTDEKPTPVIIPKSRVKFAISLEDIAEMGIFIHGKVRRGSVFLNPKGYDIIIEVTQDEIKRGALAVADVPARVICPLCRGDRKRCTLCSDRGHITKAVEVGIKIPEKIRDGEVFKVPLKKTLNGKYAYFFKNELAVKINIIRHVYGR